MKGERESALSHFHKGRAAVDDDWSRAMEEGYGILIALGLALEGTPEERQSRLLAISEMRLSKGYDDIGEKIIAEGSVADCIKYDWLSNSEELATTATLKWWSPAEIEQLTGALTGAGTQMFRDTIDKATAKSVSSKVTK